MPFRVDLTARAARNLRRIYRTINAANSGEARAWFNGLEKTVLSLVEHPGRGATIPEDQNLCHLLYGRKPHVYRIIYLIEERRGVVTVLHIRQGARDAFKPDDGE
jgi:toxin ParE1/3/4